MVPSTFSARNTSRHPRDLEALLRRHVRHQNFRRAAPRLFSPSLTALRISFLAQRPLFFKLSKTAAASVNESRERHQVLEATTTRSANPYAASNRRSAANLRCHMLEIARVGRRHERCDRAHPRCGLPSF